MSENKNMTGNGIDETPVETYKTQLTSSLITINNSATIRYLTLYLLSMIENDEQKNAFCNGLINNFESFAAVVLKKERENAKKQQSTMDTIGSLTGVKFDSLKIINETYESYLDAVKKDMDIMYNFVKEHEEKEKQKDD